MTHATDVGYELQSSLLVSDREADSVAHLRIWSQLAWYWLVRVKEGGRVSHEGHERKLREVASTLHVVWVREVMDKGHPARQWLASHRRCLIEKSQAQRSG